MAEKEKILKRNIRKRLTNNDSIEASRVDVFVHNGRVTLKGMVHSYLSKSCAFKEAWKTPGVTEVINQIVVMEAPDVSIPIMDMEIINCINRKITETPGLERICMDVIVNAGQVILKGTVDTYWKKVRTENIIADIPGVLLIENNIVVVPTDSTTDKKLADDVVSSLHAQPAIDTKYINVNVKNGIVTLNGRVPDYRSREVARDMAYKTSGVTDVNNLLAVMTL